MMTESGIWTALGITRTRNEGEIHIGYTRRLKAIDADTRALIALRSAYDAALATARGQRTMSNWIDTPFEVPNIGDLALPDDALPAEATQLQHLFEAAANAGRCWLAAEEKIELRRCWAAIAAHADGSNTDRYRAIEQAVRWLILRWGPLAVGLVPFAVDHFRWSEAEGEIAEDGTLADILWRYRAIQFLQRARRSGHSHHPAWAELTSPYFKGSSRGRCDPSLVYELLGVVRAAWPEVETEFDPGRVALWGNNTADLSHPENLETRAPYGPAKTTIIVIAALYMLWVIFGIFFRAATGR